LNLQAKSTKPLSLDIQGGPMNQYRELSDEELIQLLRRSNHGAFAEIYRRYKGVLYLHTYRKLTNEEETDDLLHDLFAALWDRRTSLTIRDSLSAYLYRSVRNRVFDHIAHQKVVDRYEHSFQNYLTNGPLLADHLVRERELRRVIEVEVANLPIKMQQIFKLSRFHQFSHKEIAKQLTVSEKTVKNQVNNGLKVLRNKLSPLFFLLLSFYQ